MRENINENEFRSICEKAAGSLLRVLIQDRTKREEEFWTKVYDAVCDKLNCPKSPNLTPSKPNPTQTDKIKEILSWWGANKGFEGYDFISIAEKYNNDIYEMDLKDELNAQLSPEEFLNKYK